MGEGSLHAREVNVPAPRQGVSPHGGTWRDWLRRRRDAVASSDQVLREGPALRLEWEGWNGSGRPLFGEVERTVMQSVMRSWFTPMGFPSVSPATFSISEPLPDYLCLFEIGAVPLPHRLVG